MSRMRRNVMQRCSACSVFGTVVAGFVLVAISACGAAHASPESSTPSASASAPVSAAARPPATGTGACTATPVPGCTVVGDPFGVPKSCHITPGVLLSAHSNEDKLPSYGYGSAPVYLSGQDSWYAGGEEADFLIDPTYTGAVHITGHLAGSATTVPIFTGSDVNGAGIDVPSGSAQPYWRFWDGQMSFPTPGCYMLNVQDDVATHSVTIYVHPGTAPPG